MVARKQLWTEANHRLFSIIEKSVGVSSKHIIAAANTADESNGKAAYVLLRKFAHGGNIHDWKVAARHSCQTWTQDRSLKLGLNVQSVSASKYDRVIYTGSYIYRVIYTGSYIPISR